jgi:hypothetical protein
VELLFALDKSEELDAAPHGNSYTVSVLSVGDVKRCNATLHFAREKWEAPLVDYDENGDVIDAADERVELVELLICKYGSPESNRVIRLRPWALHWNESIGIIFHVPQSSNSTLELRSTKKWGKNKIFLPTSLIGFKPYYRASGDIPAYVVVIVLYPQYKWKYFKKH